MLYAFHSTVLGEHLRDFYQRHPEKCLPVAAELGYTAPSLNHIYNRMIENSTDMQLRPILELCKGARIDFAGFLTDRENDDWVIREGVYGFDQVKLRADLVARMQQLNYDKQTLRKITDVSVGTLRSAFLQNRTARVSTLLAVLNLVDEPLETYFPMLQSPVEIPLEEAKPCVLAPMPHSMKSLKAEVTRQLQSILPPADNLFFDVEIRAWLSDSREQKDRLFIKLIARITDEGKQRFFCDVEAESVDLLLKKFNVAVDEHFFPALTEDLLI